MAHEIFGERFKTCVGPAWHGIPRPPFIHRDIAEHATFYNNVSTQQNDDDTAPTPAPVVIDETPNE